MMTQNEAAQIFDTLLSIPGMSEMVRIDMKISRKNILLLQHVIERGLMENEGSPSVLLKCTTEQALNELKQLSVDCLSRAGLSELNEKLAALSPLKKL